LCGERNRRRNEDSPLVKVMERALSTVSDLCVDSFVTDGKSQLKSPRNDDFTFFPDLIDKSSLEDEDESFLCEEDSLNGHISSEETHLQVDTPPHTNSASSSGFLITTSPFSRISISYFLSIKIKKFSYGPNF
jgi:hypothetical protein